MSSTSEGTTDCTDGTDSRTHSNVPSSGSVDSVKSVVAVDQKRLDRRLDTPPFDKSLWGVAVVDHKGKLLYGRNERRLFTPASNTKLVVTAVASALLPPGLTVRTSVYAGGPIVAGVLRGDVVLYGRGDPTFSRRCYATDSLAPGVCD